MNTKIIEKNIEDKSSSDFEDISVKNEDWKYVGKNVFDINNFDTGKESKLTTNKEFNVDSNCHSHSVNNEIEGITAEIDEGPLSGTPVASSASGDLKVNNILINGYIDIPLGKKLTPYIGGGVGASKLDIDNIIVDGDVLESANTWLFGYQGKLGVNYALTKTFNIFGEGTYSVFSDMGVAGDEYALESSSDINYRAGVTLKF